jgi:hypothetical protein
MRFFSLTIVDNIMGEYKLVGKKLLSGKKKLVYSKTGSRKIYVKSKGRMINIIKYKKMKSKNAAKSVKKGARKSRKSKKSKK